MPVRSKRLAQGKNTAANVSESIYTVSSGETTIVKCVQFFYRSATVPGDVRFTVNISGGASNPDIIHWVPVAQRESVIFLPFLVLQEGDGLSILCSVASGVNFYVSGAELEGAAD